MEQIEPLTCLGKKEEELELQIQMLLASLRNRGLTLQHLVMYYLSRRHACRPEEDLVASLHNFFLDNLQLSRVGNTVETRR